MRVFFRAPILPQMLVLVLAIWLGTFVRSGEPQEIRACNALRTTNPCALRDAGCVCIPTVAMHITSSMAEHCGWPPVSVCETPRDLPLISTRIRALRKWLDTWSAIGAIPGACFNHAQCAKVAAQLVDANATLIAMHGLGVFVGPDEWCDLVGLTTHYVSKNIFSMLFLSQFSDDGVAMGADGNTYSVILPTCAVRTFQRPNTIMALRMEAKFRPNSDAIQRLTVEDATDPGATWIRDTGFGAVARSNIWLETRALCGYAPGAPPCANCGTANRTMWALLSEIRPARYCPLMENVQPLAEWDSIPGLRHARVC